MCETPFSFLILGIFGKYFVQLYLSVMKLEIDQMPPNAVTLVRRISKDKAIHCIQKTSSRVMVVTVQQIDIVVTHDINCFISFM